MRYFKFRHRLFGVGCIDGNSCVSNSKIPNPKIGHHFQLMRCIPYHQSIRMSRLNHSPAIRHIEYSSDDNAASDTNGCPLCPVPRNLCDNNCPFDTQHVLFVEMRCLGGMVLVVYIFPHFTQNTAKPPIAWYKSIHFCSTEGTTRRLPLRNRFT